MNKQRQEAITQLYIVFDRYPRPDVPAVCPLCGAGIDHARLRRTDLRDWSDADLVAIHVLSLPEPALRHFLPRVLELLLGGPCAAFEFGLSGLEGRAIHWLPAEYDAIDRVLRTAWEALLSMHPVEMDYVSSATDLLNLAAQLHLSISGFLDIADRRQNPAADLHVASLVDFAYTTADRTAAAPITTWLGRAISLSDTGKPLFSAQLVVSRKFVMAPDSIVGTGGQPTVCTNRTSDGHHQFRVQPLDD